MNPSLAPNPLRRRLATLRRLWRFVVAFRGAACFVACLVLCIAFAGLLDWMLRLPGLVRAVLLAGTLATAGVIAYRLLWRPLSSRSDDLSLALQVELQYPELNDALASAVQFLEQPSERMGSEAMRSAAVRQALRRTEECNFTAIVDRRGTGLAGLALACALVAAVAFLMWQPELARTAVVRLADPFGEQQFPADTRLVDLKAPILLPRGEPFDLRAGVEGVVPDRALIRISQGGKTTHEQMVPIARREGVERGELAARIDRSRVETSFKYQVLANDTATKWQEVRVVAPPILAPLDGRPSPQTEARFPAYTDLPPHRLADGSRSFSGVAGTQYHLRAAADRPVERAWIEFRPEQPAVKSAAMLTPLAATNFAQVLLLDRSAQEVWDRVPVRTNQGLKLDAVFQPWVSGTYGLRLEDADGVGSWSHFAIGVQTDPPPAVQLERPSASLDSLSFLPDAQVTVQFQVEDQRFAVRSAYLEYRTRKEDPPRKLPLFDHAAFGAGLPAIFSSLAGPVPPPATPWKMRSQRLFIVHRLSLKLLKHLDGAPLREGDVLTLQACANDFDDVTVDKQPGRSHEVELRIVGLPALEAQLHQQQSQVQQELQRLREQEREAIKKVAVAELQEKNTGKLGPQELKELNEALELQRQIRSRIGNQQEGLRAEVARIQNTLRDNHLPRSGTHERMEMVAGELERLAREELEPIESLLTNARKEAELALDKPMAAKASPTLPEAKQHQGEVERTLEEMLARLDAWSNSRQARAEARGILQEQRKLGDQTEHLPEKIPPGRDPTELTPEQRADLEKSAEGQRRLAEHANQFLQKMERIARERATLAEDKAAQARLKEELAEEKKAQAKLEKDPAKKPAILEEERALRKDAAALKEDAKTLQDEAKALLDAAAKGREGQLENQMKQAAEQIGRNQVSNAAKDQQASAKTLEQVVKALEDRREEELDTLAKKLRQAMKELEEIEKDQDKLQKKAKDAQAIKDPAARKQELDRLAREQEQLKRRAQDLGRDLARLRAEKARDALNRATEKMEDALERLERGEKPEEQQDEALDRLAEAKEDLKENKDDAEEELAREKLAKVADQIKRLRERQEALVPERERIHRQVLQNKDWDRVQRTNLRDLARAQKGLGQEVRDLSEGKLKDASVFARMLKMAADAMDQSSQSMEKREQEAADRAELDVPAEEAADRKTDEFQKVALLRLDQLLEAIKPEQGVPQRAAKPQEQPPGQEPKGQQRSQGSDIPPLAQLKALRMLQQEVNQRTEDFARKNPDPKLNEKQKADLNALRKDQATVADLLDELTAPEGGKP